MQWRDHHEQQQERFEPNTASQQDHLKTENPQQKKKAKRARSTAMGGEETYP